MDGHDMHGGVITAQEWTDHTRAGPQAVEWTWISLLYCKATLRRFERSLILI